MTGAPARALWWMAYSGQPGPRSEAEIKRVVALKPGERNSSRVTQPAEITANLRADQTTRGKSLKLMLDPKSSFMHDALADPWQLREPRTVGLPVPGSLVSSREPGGVITS